MKKYILLFILVTFSFASGVISCSDSETRLNSVLNQATVVINLGMPEEHASAPTSVMDRIFHFFIRDAVAQTAPAAFSSITVRVTGPDLSPTVKSFTPTGSISFSVPAGNVRTFEVTAVVAPGDPSVAASFRGTAVANLPAGATVNIPIVMRLNEAKIIVPDYTNARLVILNSMAGGWAERQYDTCGDACYMNPTDIDFDARGRMYVLDASRTEIFRFDNINLDNPFTLNNISSLFSGYQILSIAIDRINGYLYISSSSILYRTALDGTNPRNLNLDGITQISSIDVAPDGTLIIAGYPSTINRYNPDYDRGGGQFGKVVASTAFNIRQPLIIKFRG
ncbi:MAG TPA: hypothetical protein PLC28_19280 [Spirochaetota bacterium]|nr:hypothetical protein [Spirochaetota bacterium]HQJ72858.1 hypothetical protein [Spirochaetota bacterium]HRS79613.1 hypothetical protein [Spirochaetota bacterium]HRT77313.1 hypothetical protein [Spirochaetota bacterium]